MKDDSISRQAAIDALMAWEEDSIWDEECLKHRGEPFWVSPSDVIEKLPPAQPERKGHWKLLTNGDAICSECGRKQKGVWDFDNWDNFCRHCGADMRGESDETD